MNFVVYKSSAGSGKTHTLVREYLHLVLANPENYRHILAITFTNKAANEMKSRILENLNKLMHYNQNEPESMLQELMDFFCNKLQLDRAGVSKRAEQVLGRILHNYSNFAVSTIDSFTHRLVRSFARDLRLPLNFEVALNTDQLITKSINLLISKVGIDESLTRALVQFVETQMDDEKSWNIERDLKKFAGKLLAEDSAAAVDKLRGLEVNDFIRINGVLNGKLQKFEKRIAAPAKEAIDLIGEYQIRPAAFYQGNRGIYKYLERLANHDFSKIKPNSYVQKTIDDEVWYAKSCPADEQKIIDDIIPQLTVALKEIMQLVEKLYPEYCLIQLILKNIYPIAVLNEIEKVMNEFRENENLVHISEFNKRIAAIVESEPVPFIYERVGEKYRHFLVDEFQDTSQLQWKNLLPLFENSLGSNQFNMIVGDGKQAIYRWRGGEVEQFSMLPKIYHRPDNLLSAAREKLLESQYNEVVLEKNYRSAADIIRFNNDFFGYAKRFLDDSLAPIYADVAQQYDPQKTGGLVQIEFLEKGDMDKEAFETAMLERTLALVRDELNDYRRGDIAILTRTGDEGSKTARMLLENGISVVSSEVLRLDASPEVIFLIAMLRHLYSPPDKIPQAEVVTYLCDVQKLPFANLHQAFGELFGKNEQRQTATLLQVLKQNGFDLEGTAAKNLTLPELIEAMIDTFGLDPDGHDPFMQFLLDEALEYTITNNEGLAGFLDFWDEEGYKKSIAVPETDDAVSIMTIHKAKGLQFPVVIYPFANSRQKLSNEEVWIEPGLSDVPELKTALVKINSTIEETNFSGLKEKETAKSFLDNLNVLYVTLTRPKERIYILTLDKTNAKGAWAAAKSFPDTADLLHGFLIENELWQEDHTVYSFGRPTVLPNAEHLATESQTPMNATAYAGPWRQKAGFRRMAPTLWNVDEPDKSRKRGTLIHTLMAKVHTAGDVEYVLDEALNQGLITAEDRPELEDKIRRVISLPALVSCFSKEKTTFTEKDILLTDGSIVRPDRIVTSGNHCTVIDYKTGQPAASHKKQIQAYTQTLREMGYHDVKALLVYLDEEEVVEV